MHVPIPAFIMETIWSIVCRMRGVNRREPSRAISLLLPLPLMRYHSISPHSLFCPVPLPLISPVRPLYEPSSIPLACSCSRTCQARALYICGDTRTTKLLIALPRRANAKDFRLHAWRATKGATRKSFVVIRTRALVHREGGLVRV